VYFLARWKLSFVTPIFKNGRRSDVSNYRGIAINNKVLVYSACMRTSEAILGLLRERIFLSIPHSSIDGFNLHGLY
jgi:hypothetical protein